MTLKEILQLCRKYLAVVITLPLISLVVSVTVCWGFLPDEYTAQKAIYVLSKKDMSMYNSQYYESNILAEQNWGISYSQQLCNDVAELVKSNRVRDAVAEELDINDLNNYNITVDSSEKNRVITLKVVSPNANKASEIVDSLVDHTVVLSKEVTDVESINIIDDSKVPDKPSGPPRILYTGCAVLAVLFLTLIIILFKDVIDTTIKNREDLIEVFQYPVLSSVPKVNL